MIGYDLESGYSKYSAICQCKAPLNSNTVDLLFSFVNTIQYKAKPDEYLHRRLNCVFVAFIVFSHVDSTYLCVTAWIQVVYSFLKDSV